MITYSNFQPTGFDCKGLDCESEHEDYQDWLVLPVGNNRDAGLLDRCNWDSARAQLRELDPDENDWEELRFGHWACGWFELVIVRPGSPAAKLAEELEGALADYPVLDDDMFSEREWEATLEAWKSLRRGERMRIAHSEGTSKWATPPERWADHVRSEL